jgi:anti-anti-sigma factor
VAHHTGKVCVLTVDGELDMLTVPQLRACASDQLAAGPAHLIIDLRRLRFLGVSGLSCLLQVRELVEQHPVSQLHLAGLASRLVARPLKISGLLGFFDSYPTLADALTALATGSAAQLTADNDVFSAWWCDSVGATWTLELRGVDQVTLGPPVEWICSGVPIDQPAPTQQTARLLRERDLLLVPHEPGRRVQRSRHRQLAGYVIPRHTGDRTGVDA